MRKLDIAERRQIKKDKERAIKIRLVIIFFVIGSIFFLLWTFLGEASGKEDSSFYDISFIGIFSIIGAFYLGLSLFEYHTHQNYLEEEDLDGKNL